MREHLLKLLSFEVAIFAYSKNVYAFFLFNLFFTIRVKFLTYV